MEQEGRTVTRARRLEDNERPAELARMLSGTRITDTVLKHARDMLRAAK
jgi:DNA repair protein RecN (Recombination protein N)